MDIEKELSSNQTILLMIPGASYNEILVDIAKKLSNKNVCYVTINKTYESLKETFEKNKINLKNIVFIDAISKSIKKAPEQGNQVYYVSSPGALTELSLVISKFLKHDFDYIIFDSLTNLSIYNKMTFCAKFLSSLVNKIKKGKTQAVFYGLQGKEGTQLAQHASTFVDKVLDAQTEKTVSSKNK